MKFSLLIDPNLTLNGVNKHDFVTEMTIYRPYLRNFEVGSLYYFETEIYV